MTTREVQRALRALSDQDIAEHSQRFFKTGKGEYGEGDKFLGIRVPVLRKQVRQFQDLSLAQTLKLLKSPYHEERLFALLLLVHQFQRGDSDERKAIYHVYLTNTRFINNWDLVDASAHHIVGAYLSTRSRRPLKRLAKSKELWERRIAIMATYFLIKKDDYRDALEISALLIDDQQDLIHKAVGWMLREVGKRNIDVEKEFLAAHYKTMPRTMLRYAIERFPERERKRYLRGTA